MPDKKTIKKEQSTKECDFSIKEQLFDYIDENYEIKDFIQELIDHFDLNFDINDNTDDEGDNAINVIMDKEGFYSIK
jgi:hypothetical protein